MTTTRAGARLEVGLVDEPTLSAHGPLSGLAWPASPSPAGGDGNRRQWSRAPARQPGWTPPLVGRGPELARLDQEFHRAVAGRLRVVLLSGETGAGKTRLG